MISAIGRCAEQVRFSLHLGYGALFIRSRIAVVGERVRSLMRLFLLLELRLRRPVIFFLTREGLAHIREHSRSS
jgi:hypothetical protein